MARVVEMVVAQNPVLSNDLGGQMSSSTPRTEIPIGVEIREHRQGPCASTFLHTDASILQTIKPRKIPSFRPPSGYVRVLRRDLDEYVQSSSSSSVPGLPSCVDSGREENQMLSLELQRRRLQRDLQQINEEDAEGRRKRGEANGQRTADLCVVPCDCWGHGASAAKV